MVRAGLGPTPNLSSLPCLPPCVPPDIFPSVCPSSALIPLGFSAGRFTNIVCKALPASYDPSPPATGSPSSASSSSTAAFRAALGAVRSAHLFVTMVGSRGTHAFFMRSQPHTDTGAESGGSGVVEVRPCGWGSEHSQRADLEADALRLQLERGGKLRQGGATRRGGRTHGWVCVQVSCDGLQLPLCARL